MPKVKRNTMKKQLAVKKRIQIQERENKNEIPISFLIKLFGHVFLEVLNFGNRRQLAKLESKGDKFRWLIERYYHTRPFLPMDTILHSGNVNAWVSLLNGFPEYGILRSINISLSNLSRPLNFNQYLAPLSTRINATKIHLVINKSNNTNLYQLLYLLDNELTIFNSRSFDLTILIYDEDFGRRMVFLMSMIEWLLSNENFDKISLQIQFASDCDSVRNTLQLNIHQLEMLSNNFKLEPIAENELRRLQKDFTSQLVENVLQRYYRAYNVFNHIKMSFESADRRGVPFTIKLSNVEAIRNLIPNQTIRNTNTCEQLSFDTSDANIFIIKREHI